MLEQFSFEGIFVLLSLISYIVFVCNYSLGTVNNFIEISYAKLNNFTLGMVVDTLQPRFHKLKQPYNMNKMIAGREWIERITPIYYRIDQISLWKIFIAQNL